MSNYQLDQIQILHSIIEDFVLCTLEWCQCRSGVRYVQLHTTARLGLLLSDKTI